MSSGKRGRSRIFEWGGKPAMEHSNRAESEFDGVLTSTRLVKMYFNTHTHTHTDTHTHTHTHTRTHAAHAHTCAVRGARAHTHTHTHTIDILDLYMK